MADQHRAMLRRYALRLSGNPANADDLVQESLVRAMSSFATLPREANHAAWLITILGRLFVDHARHRIVQNKAETELIQRTELAADTPVALASDVELRAAIDQLEPTLGEVVELRYFRGMKYKDIAAQLGEPTGTIGTRLLRAHACLRALLTPPTTKAPK